jgi:hypothetical protein
MLRTVMQSQMDFLNSRLDDLLCAKPMRFADITPSVLPERPGVYVISALLEGSEHSYYVGRTKNIRHRLYSQHLMGPLANARLKKYLIACGECSDLAEAKKFIRDFCSARWIEQEGFRDVQVG